MGAGRESDAGGSPHRRAAMRSWSALVLCIAAMFDMPAQAFACALEPGGARGVVRVIDGETLGLDDGAEVRLIGALAPRAQEGHGHEAGWLPEKAAIEELERLVLGKTIELGFSGRRTDRYGRSLAHAFVGQTAERIWVQEHMVRHGHARAYTLPQNTACAVELIAAESDARRKRAGLWGYAAYDIRPAGQPHQLLRYRNSYQLVEGTVVRAASVRGQVFLNFGEDWREDFTVIVRPSNARALEQAGIDLKALEGRRMRVRGWIERRSGPAIEIHDPSQIEVMTDQ